MSNTLVTGAGSGIGAAVSRLLAAEGANVILADVDLDAVEALAREIGPNTRPLQLDVRDEEQVAPAMADLDVLINVAGIGSTTSAPDTPLEVWENVFAVNALGTFLCCKHAIPGMAARGGGSIVNMGSVAALVGLRNRAAYCASKGAVVALTRALAVDHVGDGIRVNAVCPGDVATPMLDTRPEIVEHGRDEGYRIMGAHVPLQRIARPEEIAKAVLFLASDDSAYMTGAMLSVDGGSTAG